MNKVRLMRQKDMSSVSLIALMLLSTGFLPLAAGLQVHPIARSDEGGNIMSVPLSFPEAQAVVDNSSGYITLELEGATGYIRSVGAPMLPFCGKMLAFPLGTRVLGADMVNALYDDHLLACRIMPAPEPVSPVSGGSPAPLTEGPAYGQDALFPEDEIGWSLTTGVDDWGRLEAHLMLKVFPIRYDAVTGKVVQLKSGQVDIRYSLPAPAAPRGNETYDMLVLTPPEFQTEMGRYVLSKEAIGFKVKMANLTEVYANTLLNVSNGRDKQEKIKLFIASAVQNWTVKYVVLVGDTDKFPTRTAAISDIDGYYTPCDLYYGDLFKGGNSTFCDWDKDHDNLFGESTSSSANADGADLDPDVSVGRFPAGTEAELRAMINKTIAYAGNVSSEWFRNVTLVGSDTFANCAPWYDSSGVAEGEYSCDQAALSLSPFNLSKYYETKGTFSPTNIKNRLDRGEGFAIFADHGNVGGVVYPSSIGGVGLSSSTATALSNGPKLPLSILDACLTHAIDNSECLGEYLVLNPNGGSINSIGATRIAYGMYGTWHTYANSGYMNVHLTEQFSKGTIMPSPMLDKTKRSYLSSVGIWDYADFKTLAEYIQLGDPVTFLGGQGITFVPENGSLSADPGASAYHQITIRNTALHPDTVRLNVSEGKWRCALGVTEVSLAANSSINISIRVDVDASADAYELDNATISLVPKSTGLPLELNVTTTANCIRKIDFSLNDTRLAGYPGENISINYSIHNGGNVAERAGLRMTGGQDGWKVSETLATRVVLQHSQVRGNAMLAIPQKCLAGTYYFHVEMRTESGLSRAGDIEVEVGRTFGFSIRALNDRATVTGCALFELNVVNEGNHLDSCGLSISRPPDGWSFLCPARLSLEAFSNENVTLTAMPGKWALAGDHGFQLRLLSSDGIQLHSIDLTATVDRNSSLSLRCPVTSQQVEQGSDLSFDLLISSASNFEETIFVAPAVMPAGWGWFLAPETICVKPFGDGTASITFQVPDPCPAGHYEMELAASTPAWKKNVRVAVEVLERRTFTAFLDRYQERLVPGAGAAFELTVKNAGNCRDMYLLSAGGPFSISFSDNMLELDPLSQRTIGVGLEVPGNLPSGDYRMSVGVGSVRDPRLWATLTINVMVDRVSRLTVDYDARSEAAVGMDGSFWLRITNSGPEDETVRLESLQPSWSSPETDLLVLAGAKIQVPVKFTVPDGIEGGDYQLSFVASSEMQSWNVDHTVTVPAQQPVRSNTSKATSSSPVPLVLLILTAMALLFLIVVLSVLLSRKRRPPAS